MEDSKENQLKNTVSFSKDFLISSDNNDEDPHASIQNSPKQITFNKSLSEKENSTNECNQKNETQNTSMDGNKQMRIKAKIIPNPKSGLYASSPHYKIVPIVPETIVDESDLTENISLMTNAASRFITDNIQQIHCKGLLFIKKSLSNDNEEISEPPKSATKFVWQNSRSNSKSAELSVKSAMSNIPIRRKKFRLRSKYLSSSTPSKFQSIDVEEYRIKLAQIRSLDITNQNKLSIVNEITSGTYKQDDFVLDHDQTIIKSDNIKSSNSDHSFSLELENKKNEEINSNETESNLELNRKKMVAKSEMLISSDSLPIKRPNSFNYPFYEFEQYDRYDTPSPRSPMSQAQYLAPKESSNLDDLIKLINQTTNKDYNEKNYEPKIKPPILTFSDIILEIRIKSAEKILLTLMNQVNYINSFKILTIGGARVL